MPPLGKSTVNISVYTPKGPPVLPWPSGQRHNVHVRIVTRIVYTAARGGGTNRLCGSTLSAAEMCHGEGSRKVTGWDPWKPGWHRAQTKGMSRTNRTKSRGGHTGYVAEGNVTLSVSKNKERRRRMVENQQPRVSRKFPKAGGHKLPV